MANSSPRKIELLAPAKDAATARAAIDHGADAVYIGPSAFGARAAAGNSTDDLRRLADYAHSFRARVYATFNTILKENELPAAERLIRDLYDARIDALIVQDMGILRLDIPPIELHASTQCDTRTPEKARFLQDVGFSQIVLARELTLEEIAAVCAEVSVPVETFIHGALCVSYSGRCHAGEAFRHRSANRGECPQICRLPYTLRDADGKVLLRDRHLLSLRDFNASASLPDLLRAGVSSFKIEGRLKDTAYVKNITAYYRGLIDREIEARPDLYARSSCGRSELNFEPRPEKSFNRGFTDYFLTSRRPVAISSPLTPKSLGEEITSVGDLHNGDGISFFTPEGEYKGVRINRVEGSRIIPATQVRIPVGTKLYRTFDRIWEQQISRDDTARRSIAVDVELFENRVTATDERGNRVTLQVDLGTEQARKPMDEAVLWRTFAKTGDTIYRLRNFMSHIPASLFVPLSLLTNLRRQLLEALDSANRTTYPFPLRRPEKADALYPAARLDYRDNVANSLAETFYRSHGVTEIEAALEVQPRRTDSEFVVMTCRHCILRENGRCLRGKASRSSGKDATPWKQPLTIENGDIRMRLRFDCNRCEMQALKLQ